MVTVVQKHTEQDIVRELARLRMWRDVANADECRYEEDAAHDRINNLLDLLDKQREKVSR